MVNEKILFLIGAFIFGSIIGSFLNVLIYRLPRGLTPFKPIFSFCPNCKTKIKYYDNIPIISYLFLKGKCRNCKSPISLRYPIVEALTGFASVLAYLKAGLSVDYVFTFLFLALMITLSFIDFDFKIIPDEINFLGFILGLIYTFFRDNYSLLDGIIGAGIGGGFLFAIAYFYKKLKGIEGLGMGDVKLMIFIGSYIGWFGALFTIFLGSILGTIIALVGALASNVEDKGKYEIPFGPYLAIAGSIYILIGDRIKALYFGG